MEINTNGYNDCDWPEDFRMENGKYQVECITCRRVFIGHKRRTQCKTCFDSAVKEFSLMNESEREEAMKKRMQEIADWFSRNPEDPTLPVQER